MNDVGSGPSYLDRYRDKPHGKIAFARVFIIIPFNTRNDEYLISVD